MSNLSKLLNKKLRKLAEKRGFQAELAKKSGLSRQYISQITGPDESVLPSVTLETLEKIAEALGVPVTSLLEDDVECYSLENLKATQLGAILKFACERLGFEFSPLSPSTYHFRSIHGLRPGENAILVSKDLLDILSTPKWGTSQLIEISHEESGGYKVSTLKEKKTNPSPAPNVPPDILEILSRIHSKWDYIRGILEPLVDEKPQQKKKEERES